MKKFAMLLTLVALASSASAGLLSDTTFDGTMTSVSGGFSPSAAPEGQWFADPLLWEVSGGVATKISGTTGNLWQKIAFPGLGDYTLTFDYKTTSTSLYPEIHGSGGVNWPGVNDNINNLGDIDQIIGGTGNVAIINDGAWHTGVMNFTIDQAYLDANGAKTYLFVYLREYSGASGAQIDNVDITPEPATMSLLGIGGLALLRRHRR